VPRPTLAAVEPDELRASDGDRERVAARLHAAAAEGRLTLDELGERLGVLYGARTYGELVPLTRDLPAASPVSAPLPVTGASGPGFSVAVLSGCDRAGELVVPERHTALAFMGGVELDLRRARFAAPEVAISCLAVMGGIVITVPHDMDVDASGFGLMGAFDSRGAGSRPGAQRVRVSGFALMGAVEVKRAEPPEPEIEGPSKELTI
jgi:hypothetical protein